MARTDSTTSSSSLTSTSHTLTALGPQPSPTTTTPASTAAVVQTMPVPEGSDALLVDALRTENRHVFLRPPTTLPIASLAVAKNTLDGFAGQVADGQLERIKNQGKRKRGEEKAEVLKMRKVHVDGFETSQVWQQAKRIVMATLREVEESLRDFGDTASADSSEAIGTNPSFADSDREVDINAEVGGGSSDVDEDIDHVTREGEVESDELEDDQNLAGSSDADDFDVEEEDWDEDESQADHDDEDMEQPLGEFVEDPNGLNDGFFSIDEFNKQSQWLEEQDARADPNTDQASEDEELDWHADPMTSSSKAKKQHSTLKRLAGEEAVPDLDEGGDEDEDDEDDENGPTFGDMDLDAPEGASDDDMDEGMGGGMDDGPDLTANDIFYKDFFAPPARKVKKGDKPKSANYVPRAKPDDGDVERAMNNVHRDLFDDLSEEDDSDDALSEVSAGDPKSRRSAHERRQAKLAEEIRKLEAEAVAKRDWTVSGETTGTERPINSLLGEDLAFEHVGKPVSVITEEVSESLEALIKRRILAGEFDELVRRRPEMSDLRAGEARRGLVELDDTKAKQSLAEIYEEEHVKSANPDAYVSRTDEKLRREEKEVENMWKDVCARLDSLSSWHYKPKPAAPSLTVVADVATIAMEDAQPATAQGVHGGESMIAPQEVYNPGKDSAEQGEVVAKSGLPIARQEMSREEKLRRRRREKERIRKSSGQDGGREGNKPLGKKPQEKKDTMADLKKGGVRVINRKGEVVDVDGNKVAGERRAATSVALKL